MRTFNAFIDKKQRDAKKHLKIVKKLLESNQMRVVNHLDENDPYIFLYAPKKNLNFDGIRIYKIGNQLAFRIQKEEKTHPFGTAYPLNIEEMFDDLMSDHHNPEKAGKEVIKSVVSEVTRFFDKSAEAEKELQSNMFDPRDGGYAMRSTMTDFSNLVYMKGY